MQEDYSVFYILQWIQRLSYLVSSSNLMNKLLFIFDKYFLYPLWIISENTEKFWIQEKPFSRWLLPPKKRTVFLFYLVYASTIFSRAHHVIKSGTFLKMSYITTMTSLSTSSVMWLQELLWFCTVCSGKCKLAYAYHIVYFLGIYRWFVDYLFKHFSGILRLQCKNFPFPLLPLFKRWTPLSFPIFFNLSSETSFL